MDESTCSSNSTASSQPKVRDGVDRTHYTPEMDIVILKECINTNPFLDGSWNVILNALDEFSTRPATGRSIKDRVQLLLNYFHKEQMIKINKSGTEETYSEREQLLQDVWDLRQMAQEKPKTKKKPAVVQTDIRKRAMETLKGDETNIPRKTPKVNPKREMVAYLEKKREREAELREEELKLRREELKLQQDRFILEQKEREARLLEDREDKKLMREMMIMFMANKNK